MKKLQKRAEKIREELKQNPCLILHNILVAELSAIEDLMNV